MSTASPVSPSAVSPSAVTRQDAAIGWMVAVLFWLYYLSPVVVRPDRWTFALVAGLPGLAALAALTLRHRRPVATVVLTGACLMVTATATGAVLVAQVSLAHRMRRFVPVLLSAGGLLAVKVVEVAVYAVVTRQPVRSSAVGFELLLLIAGLVIATLSGRLRRSQEEEEVSRAASERAEQETARARIATEEARLAEARLAERARIAREMHDVVAHRISLVAMHAGVLAHTAVDDSGRETARLIQSNAREALAELRVVLADLRDEDPPGVRGGGGGDVGVRGSESPGTDRAAGLRGGDAPPEPPQPTLADLPRLVADNRQAGQRIDLALSVVADEVPPRLSRQAYRIVQEGLTNARKHAPGAPVTVEVTGRSGSRLAVAVTNPLTDLAPPDTTGSRLGLVGVAERVALLGGSVTHGIREGRYELTASLPWTVLA